MAGDEQDASSDLNTIITPPRERPWLLPSNRKLRHLQGITIRNLTLVSSPFRLRGKTIDDEAIPSSLKSPAKALAQRETKKLEHSRSSSDLRSSDESARQANDSLQNDNYPPKPLRPSFSKGLQRRSTMDWSGASPLARQKKLEDVTGGRMADTFFSLHVTTREEPIYVSEMVEKAMNPNFRFFDLDSCGPDVTRLDWLTVKVWARNEHLKDWQYLIEFTVQLRALQFIGKSLGDFHHPLPPNCILFHMTDGIYTSFVDIPMPETLPHIPAAEPKTTTGRVLPTSSYDALMRLSTLDDCIQDALATRDRLAEEIETILKNNEESISIINQVPEAEENLRTVQNTVAAEKRRVEATRRKRDELKASIKSRKEAMEAGREAQTRSEAGLPESRKMLQKYKETVRNIEEEITGQRRRICEDLQRIYPIEPIQGKSLAFTIRGLPLPNSEFDDVDEVVVSAALGYVAHVVHLLSPYLSVALPYPVKPHGSTSVIEDPISMTTGPRTYPLYMKGVIRYRFEYGVFLLNKDIEILSNWLGLKLLDIRQTLPNLKYLLFVATAGKGELPARKSGGIRGLLRQGAPTMSRKGSADSVAESNGEVKDSRDEDGKKDVLGELANAPKKSDGTKRNGKAISAYQSLQKSAVLQGSKLREVE
ncbi:UV radiation resistance-associated gene protein [Lepidopterella palustris CBS 459.81]|uniref:Autophagy-related protein 14 n=1 Tax=Lepidopterella palustris CBS 459.81 TaxID=1314670 RepID=A0A8E2E094_9PEZI|nr:UV radiation resistance-associated gene protein [Lepidopterella palustris CBS 459.81]